jgi:hypothetical protein
MQADHAAGAFTGDAADGEHRAHLLDESLCRREADAQALALRRTERIEQRGELLRGEARDRVG